MKIFFHPPEINSTTLKEFMKNKIFWNSVRIIVVAAIFMYLFKSGKFEPAKLKIAFERIDLFIISTGLIFFGLLLGAQRWRYLLYIQNIHIGIWLAVKLTLAGFFFSTALPGSVSGDVIKAYYIAKGSQQKEVLVTSIFFDRLLGLYTMILVAAFALFIGYVHGLISGDYGVLSQPYIKGLALFVSCLFLALTATGILFMSSRVKGSVFMQFILSKLPFHTILTKIYETVHHYGKNPVKTFKAMLLSIIVQIPGFAGMYALALLLNIKALSFLDYFTALPVCLLINALPLAPGGLGVGEAGFRTIFSFYGSQEGAELAVLFHSVIFFVSIGIGGLIYLFSDVSRSREH